MSGDLGSRNAWVERVLGLRIPTKPGGTDKGGRGAGIRLTQALMVWNQTRSHVGQQVAALQRAILAATSDEENYADIVAGIDNIESVLSLLDDKLLEVLSAIRASKDDSEKERLSKQARSIVERCQAEAATDPLMGEIDTMNGFMTLDIKSRVTGALAQVLEMI